MLLLVFNSSLLYGCRNPGLDNKTDGELQHAGGGTLEVPKIADYDGEVPQGALPSVEATADWLNGKWEQFEPMTLFAVREGSQPTVGKYMEVCVDSGCGRSTAGPAMAEEMGYTIEPTAQSQKGHYFVGPGGEKYMNRGRVQLRSMDESSRSCLTKFHIADGVDQALGSVAEMNDSDNLVLFDGEGSAMIPGKCPEAAMIRKAMRKCGLCLLLHQSFLDRK